MVITPRIAIVSYLNTIPFVYGIEHEGSLRAELLLTTPSQCAQSFINGEVDIALLPSAIVPSLTDANIITDYCIGAVGAVRSVVLVSHTPIEEAKRIFLDRHSLTSVQLAGYLLSKHWNVDVDYHDLDDFSQLDQGDDGDVFLLIGDKVFDYEGCFEYEYDLAQEWLLATNLPFAFALWVARKDVSPEVVEALQKSLTYGIEHTYEAIVHYGYSDRDYAYDYLTKNIDYLLDNSKRESLNKFWGSGVKVAPRSNPG